MQGPEKKHLKYGLSAPPPLFKSWGTWYALVAGALLVTVVLLQMLTLRYQA